MAVLPRPVTMMIWSQPEASASSTPYWMMGLSTSGSISLGCALVAGRKRVPNPAAGNTALQTFIRELAFRKQLSGNDFEVYKRQASLDAELPLARCPNKLSQKVSSKRAVSEKQVPHRKAVRNDKS